MSGVASVIALQIKGADQTGGAFASLAKRVASANEAMQNGFGKIGNKIKEALSFNKVRESLKGIADLSGMAQRAGVSASYLDRFVGAADVLGLTGVNAESLSAAFNHMAMQTGRVGEEGFKSVLLKAAAMNSEMERTQYLTNTFGRLIGNQFLPMVRNGAAGVTAGLNDVMGMMAGASDSALESAARMSDALEMAIRNIQTWWRNSLAKIAQWIEKAFHMDIRESIGRGMVWISYFAKVGWQWVYSFVANVGKVFGAMAADWGATWQYMLGICKAYLIRIREGFVALGHLFKEFGIQIWNMLQGKKFDWNAILNAGAGGEALKKAQRGVIEAWNNKPPNLKGIKFEFPDMKALQEERDKSLETVKAGVAAIPRAASSATAKSVAAIRAAASKAIDASSYEAYAMSVRSMIQKRNTTGLSISEHLGAGIPIQQGGSVDKLAIICEAICSKLGSIDTRVGALEAV